MGGRSAGARRLPDRLRTRLAGSALLEPGDAVVVAVSGGLDSTALLHLLRFPLADLGLRLVVAHLDHAMRPGSAADARWVRGLCRAWEVPLRADRLAPPARSEADARRRRYAFLEAVADDAGADRIATGHHLDDQAETVLFRAIRGTGPRGLRGILPRRGRVVRPLLGVRRVELAEYARAVGLGWRVDPTNRELGYARNRLRHEVLPVMEAARPGTAEVLARLAAQARRAEAAWSAALARLEEEVLVRQTDTGAVLARGVLHSYDPALRARVLRHFLRRYGSSPTRAGTHAALEFISSGPSGGEIHLSGGLRLERDFDEIRILAAGGETGGDTASDRALVIPAAAPGTGRARIGGRWWDVAWGRVSPGFGGGTARLTEPRFPLIVRGWRPGDRIRLSYGTKKLKKLFGERRLDRYARRSAPVVVDGSGAVRWVVGVARAEGVGEDGVGFEIAVRDAGRD